MRTPGTYPEGSEPEAARLDAVDFSGLLDGRVPEEIDTLVWMTSELTNAPMTALTVITEDEQVVIAGVGVNFSVSDRSAAFCNHTVHHADGLLVTDATVDERFADSALVTGAPFLRSYAGVPVHVGGRALGALCLMSESSDEFGEDDLVVLRRLAGLAEQTLELGWRREVATPPLIEEVRQCAAQLASGHDADDLIGSLSQPACVFDRDSLEILNVNDAAVSRYGWTRREFLDLTILDLRPDNESVVGASIREDVGSEGQAFWDSRQTTHWDRQGHSFPAALRLADFERSGRRCRLAVVTDLSAQQALSAAVEHAANFDPLTTFGNRRFLMAQLGVICDSGQPAALLMIDIDHFKTVNDVAGHVRGDELIVAAAARVAIHLPTGSIPTRYGGDSFVVIVPDVDGNTGLQIADRIRHELEGVFRLGDADFRITASAGVTSTEPGVGPTELLSRVDDALDDAKRLGRNQTTLSDPSTRAKHQRSSLLGHELKAAIDADELEVWYQPIVDLMSGDVVTVDRAEALVRWRHPSRGIIPPGDFLGLLSASGLMLDLNRVVLDHVCRGIAELRAQGKAPKINVNCSAEQFNSALIEQIDRAVETHGVLHSDLRLEITESAFSQPSGEIDAVIAALRERTIPVVIDDFGAGHSSLGRLTDLPVQNLKLDRSFIVASSNPRGRKMLQAIFDLARAADLPITAEGIETQEQFAIVTEIGFDRGQGYLFARPAPLDELASTIRIRG